MKKDKSHPGKYRHIRKEAKVLLKKQPEEHAEDLTTEESRRMLHELRMNQIELEIQNDELRRVYEELEESITERKLVEERQNKSAREKEALLQEIHHRVKNNMTVISSLLKLQADKVKDEYYKELFNESITRIKTMALIHEKLYRSDDLARIVFSDYLKDVMADIMDSYGITARRVHFKNRLDMIILPIDTSIPCGLIVNELLSNSLKYAFPDGKSGEISVFLRNNNGKVELTVGDNGVGLPADIDFRKPGSLGLNIVNALVRQVQGDIELHRGQGTEFLITFRSDT